MLDTAERADTAGPDTSKLVVAARAGDRRALDALVARHLPLVYSIAARTLSSDTEVDAVVEDLMFRVAHDIHAIRDPARFRPCVVTGIVEAIRDRVSRDEACPASSRRVPDRPDTEEAPPDAASEQREEIEHAIRWLAPVDRALLALWWLELDGHLTRAEVIEALGLAEPEARISKLQRRLEAVRMLVRALVAVPVCPGLEEAAYDWHGEPDPAWRKHFLAHIKGCTRCRAAAADFLPTDELLSSASLVPLPRGYTRRLIAALHADPRLAEMWVPGDDSDEQPERRGFRWRPVLAFAGVVVACALGVSAAFVVPRMLSNDTPATPTPSPSPPGTALGIDADTPIATDISSSEPPPPPPPPPPSTSAEVPRPSSAPEQAPRQQPAAHTPAPDTGPAEQVLGLINQARKAAGLPPYRMDPGLVASALAHTRTMSSGCGQSHQCPGEEPFGVRVRNAGVPWKTTGENVGSGGPVADSTQAIGQMALRLTQSMLDEKPPEDGHRRNILSSSFGRIGIAVLRDESGTVWMTQDFTN